jgi:glycosyltransferase involved in cell wall biosynthesis
MMFIHLFYRIKPLGEALLKLVAINELEIKVNLDFEKDQYPQKPRILFIGLGSSTHTHAWIDLLADSDFNVRLFVLPNGGVPPDSWKVRTYLPQITEQLPEGLDVSNRKTLYCLPEEFRAIKTKMQSHFPHRFLVFLKNLLNRLGLPLGLPLLSYDFGKSEILQANQQDDVSPEAWLAKVIQEWKPDIIHTLGLFDGQGGMYYYRVRKQFGLENIGKWVLQLRGGSDLALNRFIPDIAGQIKKVAQESDQIISDNRQNVQYLKQMGVSDDHFSSLIPVPGTGGVDVASLGKIRKSKASESRIIIFSKAYESIWSKSLPVFEALKICWDRITPCTIHLFNMYPETRPWFYALPDFIRENCVVHDRVSRDEFFLFLAQARVLLIPSLVDGVPNSLYEAMALGTLPIVSPLDTICSVVENEKNVLFARNLYPEEIADALSRAMTNNNLVDQAAQNNFEMVTKLANRSIIESRVVEYYKSLTGKTSL